MSKFARAVKKYGGAKMVAAQLGCSYEFVRAIGAGTKTPGLAMALKIQEVLGIPVTYWKDHSASSSDGKAAS